MRKDRMSRSTQPNTITQYTTQRLPSQRITRQTGQDGEPEDTGEPSRAELLKAIQGSHSALERQIETVSIDVNLLRTDLRKVADKVTDAEGNIEQLQGEVASLKKTVTHLTAATSALERRAEDAEGRARRSNIRVLGVPERMEAGNPERFLETWIKTKLCPRDLSEVFVIERAHRALVPPPRPGAPPRALIAKILNYRDRDCILRAARETPNLAIENSRISIYPDYTHQVQEQRKSFLGVKQKLRAMELQYMLLYPAKLKVLAQGKAHFFESPEEVWEWLEVRGDGVPPGERGGPKEMWGTRSRRRHRSRRRRRSATESTEEPRVTVGADGTMLLEPLLLGAGSDAPSPLGPGEILVPDTIQPVEHDAMPATLVVPETGGATALGE